MRSNDEISTLVPETERANRLYWWLFAAINLVLCLPLWITEYLPLVDYPNHLARTYILYHYNDVRWFKDTYRMLVEPIPNLAIDLIVPPLMKLFDVATAGKIFLTLTILLYSLGCHMLSKAIQGQRTWLVFPCLFFSYSVMFLDGFVNYVFGLGMFLITLALWLDYRKHWTFGRVALVVVTSFLGYLAHLSAYSFLGFSVLVVTLYDVYFANRITKENFIAIIPLVPPLICFLKFMTGSGSIGELEWDSFHPKVSRAFYLLLSYDHYFDYPVIILTFLTVVYAAWHSTRAKIAWPAYAAGMFFWLLFLLCPLILFTSWGADMRFVPPAAILTLLAFRFSIPMRAGRAAFAMVLALFILRIGFIASVWHTLDKEIAEQVRMFERFEPGSKVYSMVFDNELDRDNKIKKAFRHTICWLTISRQTSCARLFANRGQQPLLFRNRPNIPGINLETPVELCDWKSIFGQYDYVFCFQPPKKYVDILKKGADLVASTNDSMMFRVRKDANAAPEPPGNK